MIADAIICCVLVGACMSVAFGVVWLGSAIFDECERRRRAAWRADQVRREAIRDLPKLTPGQLRAGDQASFRG
ncbi:hypothetical protein MWN52_09655 [Pseudoxanthomonas winnipegensis]|uniref:hypothetical protein n=1 Tax=Pseudoxanthomonas winnipegensis TaxID=2480810 RepID=UPI0025763749|nr:hypothetical protein [Pseudoxanthomonas winnipegensis]WJI17479.1 hypothetical protein MWN52_09655 [Pseudoxanthomonas winnipegensis]